MQVIAAGDMLHLVEPLFRVPNIISWSEAAREGGYCSLSLRDQMLVDELDSISKLVLTLNAYTYLSS